MYIVYICILYIEIQSKTKHCIVLLCLFIYNSIYFLSKKKKIKEKRKQRKRQKGKKMKTQRVSKGSRQNYKNVSIRALPEFGGVYPCPIFLQRNARIETFLFF